MRAFKLLTALLLFTQIATSQTITEEKLSNLSEAAKLANTEGLLVYHDGKIILEEYYGIGHKDTLIETMSCTKSIVGMAAAALLDDGYLDSLNTPVHHFYPEWNQGNKKNITVEHLLTMTSGIQNYPHTGVEIYPSPDFVQLALAAELIEMPGEQFRYNNKSVNLMSGIIMKTTGKRMDTYIAERLFEPLEISTYNWELDSSGTPHGMSGCQLKPKDFLKIGVLLLNQGTYKGKEIITKQNISKLTHPIAQNKAYGLLWWLGYEGVKITVDSEVIENLKEKGVEKEFMDKIELLRGSYTEFTHFQEKVVEVFGENPRDYILSNVSGWDDIRKIERIGEVISYEARGYLGNKLIVVPKSNLVGVRMISENSYDHDDKTFNDEFFKFRELLLELIK